MDGKWAAMIAKTYPCSVNVFELNIDARSNGLGLQIKKKITQGGVYAGKVHASSCKHIFETWHTQACFGHKKHFIF